MTLVLFLIVLFLCAVVAFIRTRKVRAAVIMRGAPIKSKIVTCVTPSYLHDILISEGKKAGLSDHDIDIMRKIGCPESHWQQFRPNGTVKVNASGHIGIFQINSGSARAFKKQGINVYTERGNIQGAIIMYKASGTSPWRASYGKF